MCVVNLNVIFYSVLAKDAFSKRDEILKNLEILLETMDIAELLRNINRLTWHEYWTISSQT